jgi:hypothetical protein
MKLKIPAADTLFKNTKKSKKISIEDDAMSWLNSEVYDKIVHTEPKLSTSLPLKVTGCVSLEVPMEYYGDKVGFEKFVKENLKPLGYKVEFTHDGVGISEICLISWNVKI